ncbi:hypothetical protein NSK_007939 [Nannochloropsis salina CCMP1776]|uniref:WW domain-containing protein n=1 Tax=Nannochloropsis salina CCMP1776 TaxID=1027361 RepID=A0A4D9CNM8_9STRA|nr:hypothetical protein NSK_007939 [Nannochloropsis salina CCMP1776]|eukprot:TFJ80762.1 hypothetical protein NSK_007939 [Nannochloropsis salina CCMP1776]
MDLFIELGLLVGLASLLLVVSSINATLVTLSLLLGCLLLLAGVLEPFEIPWYVWAGLCLYLAVRHQGSGYTKGSLCKAAADGNIALVRKLLAVNHGQYALELDHKGYSPLMHAVRRGDLPMVRLLLATNLYDAHNVSIKSRSGKSALFLAAQAKQEAMVRLLLEHGADPAGLARDSWAQRFLPFLTATPASQRPVPAGPRPQRRARRPPPPDYPDVHPGHQPSSWQASSCSPPKAIPVAVALPPSAPPASAFAHASVSPGAVREGGGEALLPGWEERVTAEGHVFYVDHVGRRTSWERPVSGVDM